MATLTDDTLLQRGDGHLSSPVGDETVLLSEDGTYYSLEGVGGDLWDWLATPQTLAGLVQRLTTEYEVGPDQARKDITAFLTDMLDAGLVVRR